MVSPRGIEEIEKLYGDPHAFIREDGTPSPLWDRRMVSVPFPVGLPLGWKVAGMGVIANRARVNEAIAVETLALFRRWYAAGLWPKLVTYDGGYNWRAMRGSDKLSMHAYGAALDFNSGTNALGTEGDMDRHLVEVAEELGWTWGGQWSRPDPMHFQWGMGY